MRFLLLGGVLSPLLYAVAGLATPWLGAVERTWCYAYQLWFMVLALVLLRDRTREDSSG